jgi:hypothetical protein
MGRGTCLAKCRRRGRGAGAGDGELRWGRGEDSCGESRGCATGGVATHAGVTGMGMWIQGCGACTECSADAAQTAVGCRGTPSWHARRALPDPP